MIQDIFPIDHSEGADGTPWVNYLNKWLQVKESSITVACRGPLSGEGAYLSSSQFQNVTAARHIFYRHMTEIMQHMNSPQQVAHD